MTLAVRWALRAASARGADVIFVGKDGSCQATTGSLRLFLHAEDRVRFDFVILLIFSFFSFRIIVDIFIRSFSMSIGLRLLVQR